MLPPYTPDRSLEHGLSGAQFARRTARAIGAGLLVAGLLLAGCGRVGHSSSRPTQEQREAYRAELAEGQRLAALVATAASDSAASDSDGPAAGEPGEARVTAEARGAVNESVSDAKANERSARGSMIETSRDRVQPHTQWTMEQLAADSLGRMGSEAVPHLVLRLREPNPVARRRVAEILARIGPDAVAAVPALTELLHDPDPTVQRTAVRALGQIGPAASAAVPSLLDLFIEAADDSQTD